MRWTSVILIFSVSCALTHDALCLEGGGETSVKRLSHHGHEHSHDAHHQTGHGHHTEENGRDSDRHGDTHDHQLEPLLIKKDISTKQRPLPGQVVMAVCSTPGSISVAVARSISHPVIRGTESSLPAYVRAHILLL